jgi:hypothetical protein
MALDQVNLAPFSTVTVKEPKTYEEAINSEKKEDQVKWKSAINKELKEMEKRGVWEIIDEKNIPINRRYIKNKWILVTLLSTEAEYVAISKAVKELKFVYYLLSDLHIKINLPIVVKTDNIRAIFMSENASTGFRTRHVNTRYHSVQEFIEWLY